MRIRILCCVLSLIVAVCFAAPVMAANVSHGKCVTNDEKAKTITIEEYDLTKTPENKYGKPTGKQTTFDVSEALLGIKAAPGDVLRIAWQEKGDKKMAIRIMNVTKQDIMKK